MNDDDDDDERIYYFPYLTQRIPRYGPLRSFVSSFIVTQHHSATIVLYYTRTYFTGHFLLYFFFSPY